VQHTACEELSRELRQAASDEMRKVEEGEALPGAGGQQLPVRDDALARALKERRRALREEWAQRAVGDQDVKAEYWRGLKGRIADGEQSLEQLNVRLAEGKLHAAVAAWEAWISKESEVSASDPGAEVLSSLLERGVPGRAAARAVREALNAARMARIRWDGTADALKAELKLANDELASRREAAQAASKLDDAALEQTREVGRLTGQIEALNTKALEAIQRERVLKEQIAQAEEATRQEQRGRAEAARKCQDLERTTGELRQQMADLKSSAGRTRDADASGSGATPGGSRGKQPKCSCSVM